MRTPAPDELLIVEDLDKAFTLHLHGGARLPVVSNVAFTVARGECVVLGGPSGVGKSSILKIVFGNYLAEGGSVLLSDGSRFFDIARATPGEIVDARRRIMGYVSQFLRVIPRVPALEKPSPMHWSTFDIPGPWSIERISIPSLPPSERPVM